MFTIIVMGNYYLVTFTTTSKCRVNNKVRVNIIYRFTT